MNNSERQNKSTLPYIVIERGGYIFTHKNMVGRLNKHGKTWTARTTCQHNVQQVLYKNNKTHSIKSKGVSQATRSGRWIEIKAAFHDLHNLGFKIIYPDAISQRHLIALTRYWESKGLKSSSVMQKYSKLCVFLRWINKYHIAESLKKEVLYENPENFTRETATTEDKSWKDVNILEVITRVEKFDRHIAHQLCLSMLFGLRAKESMLFRPQMDYFSDKQYIYLKRGTKNGRPRIIPVETKLQRQFLEQLCETRLNRNGSMIPRMSELKKWIKHYYRVLNKCGISRKVGITPHGLRHGYAHQVYEYISGRPAPILVASNESLIDLDPISEKIARRLVAERLGHSRVNIASAYIGGEK